MFAMNISQFLRKKQVYYMVCERASASARQCAEFLEDNKNSMTLIEAHFQFKCFCLPFLWLCLLSFMHFGNEFFILN